MTEQEYSEQRKKVDKYHEYQKIINGLECKLQSIYSSGIELIKSLNGLCSTTPDDMEDGDGFSELVKNKIVEAYKEQIDIIKKRKEEI